MKAGGRLAWIDAYDLTRNKDYLSMAESIFADMAASWDDTCGGGIWWSKDKDYKNAIANELFLSVAAHLVNRTAGSTRSKYLELEQPRVEVVSGLRHDQREKLDQRRPWQESGDSLRIWLALTTAGLPGPTTKASFWVDLPSYLRRTTIRL